MDQGEAGREGEPDRVESSPENVDPSSLRLAIRHGRASVVEQLLREGADVDAQETDGTNLLHAVASPEATYRAESYDARWTFNSWVVNALLDRGCDIDGRDNLGRTALHVATLNNDPNAVRVLLEAGADVDVEDNEGRIPAAYSLGTYSCAAEYKMHIVKLRAIGARVHQDNVRFLDALAEDRAHVRRLAERYEREVERMKKVGITESVSLMDLMTREPHRIAGCVRSPNFVRVLEAKDFDREFVHYGCLMRSRARKVRDALRSIEDSLLLAGFPSLCVDLISMHLSDR